MKKLILIAFALLVSIPLVKADVLPPYQPNEKIVNGKNIINVADFPERKFFQKTLQFWRQLLEKIPENGNLGCNGGSVGVAVKIWAIKKDLANTIPDQVESEYSRNDSLYRKDIENMLKEKGAIEIFSEGDAHTINCSSIVDKSYDGDEKINYITIPPEALKNQNAPDPIPSSTQQTGSVNQPITPTPTPSTSTTSTTQQPDSTTQQTTSTTQQTPSITQQTPSTTQKTPSITQQTSSSTQPISPLSEAEAAYNRAYQKGITTLLPFSQANPTGYVSRAQMAKMVVNYARNVLQKTSQGNKGCAFTDLWGVNAELSSYIIQSCEFWIMGVGIAQFRPNSNVTRAEFWTVLSRLLWGNQFDWWTPYYFWHLEALRMDNIMTNISNPTQRLEQRQWVRLMMMRSAS